MVISHIVLLSTAENDRSKEPVGSETRRYDQPLSARVLAFQPGLELELLNRSLLVKNTHTKPILDVLQGILLCIQINPGVAVAHPRYAQVSSTNAKSVSSSSFSASCIFLSFRNSPQFISQTYHRNAFLSFVRVGLMYKSYLLPNFLYEYPLPGERCLACSCPISCPRRPAHRGFVFVGIARFHLADPFDFQLQNRIESWLACP